ncbi:MAG: hypothetical protein WB392_13765, partial [Methanotrichaceae archaeon]
MKAKSLAASILLASNPIASNLLALVLIILVAIPTAASQGPYGQQYGYGDCQKQFIIGVDLQKASTQVNPAGFSVYIDGAYIGSTDGNGKLVVTAYGGQHIINVSKQVGTDTYSGSWTGTIECYYPTGGTNYVPITINQIPSETSAQVQSGQVQLGQVQSGQVQSAQVQSAQVQPLINIPKPANLEDIILIVVIAVALIIGIIIVLKSIRYFLVNAILGLLVLYLANAFAGLN